METNEQDQINGNELVCSSWLLKKTTLSWKKLWFVLRKNNQLTIYKDENEYKPLTIFNLLKDNYTISRIIKNNSNNSSSNNNNSNAAADGENLEDKGKSSDHHSSSYQFALFNSKSKSTHLRALNEYDFNNWYLNLEKILHPPSSSKEEQQQQQITEIENDNEYNNDTDEDYFASDNEQNPVHEYIEKASTILEENEDEEESLKEILNGKTSKNQQDLENIQRIIPIQPKDFMKDYLIQHYSYNNKDEHLIEKGCLLRLRNLNQWKKFYLIFTNRHLVFYKIHNYHDITNIDHQFIISQLQKDDFSFMKNNSGVIKIIDLKHLVDVVELDPLSKSKQNCLLLVTPTKRYRFCTKTSMELVNWLIVFKSFLIVRKKEEEYRQLS